MALFKTNPPPTSPSDECIIVSSIPTSTFPLDECIIVSAIPEKCQHSSIFVPPSFQYLSFLAICFCFVLYVGAAVAPATKVDDEIEPANKAIAHETLELLAELIF